MYHHSPLTLSIKWIDNVLASWFAVVQHLIYNKVVLSKDLWNKAVTSWMFPVWSNHLEGKVESSHSCALEGAGGAHAMMQHSDAAMVLTEMLLELTFLPWSRLAVPLQGLDCSQYCEKAFRCLQERKMPQKKMETVLRKCFCRCLVSCVLCTVKIYT